MTRTDWLCVLLVLAFGAAGVTGVVLFVRGGREIVSTSSGKPTPDVSAPAPMDGSVDRSLGGGVAPSGSAGEARGKERPSDDSALTYTPPAVPPPMDTSVPSPIQGEAEAKRSQTPADAMVPSVAPVQQAPVDPPANATPDAPGDVPRPGIVQAMFLPDGRLVTVLSDGSTWYRDLGSGARQELGAKLGAVSACALAPDRKRIFVIDAGGDMKILDAGTWQEIETFRTGVAGVKDLAVSPDGRSVALAGNGVVVWDTKDKKSVRSLHSGQACGSVSYAGDGRQLLTASAAGATFWETTFWQKEAGIAQNDLVEARFWPGRAVFVTLAKDGAIRIYDSVSRRVQTTRVGAGGATQSMVLSPDGRTIVSTGGGVLNVWDTLSSATRTLK